jgi:hypothetical protein
MLVMGSRRALDLKELEALNERGKKSHPSGPQPNLENHKISNAINIKFHEAMFMSLLKMRQHDRKHNSFQEFCLSIRFFMRN